MNAYNTFFYGDAPIMASWTIELLKTCSKRLNLYSTSWLRLLVFHFIFIFQRDFSLLNNLLSS